MSNFVFLKKFSFDMDKVTYLAVEEADKYADIVMYLNTSKHVIYRERLDGFSSYEDVKAIELIKFFYDSILLNAEEAIKSNNAYTKGMDFRLLEDELEKVIEEFKEFFTNNEEFKNLQDELVHTHDFLKVNDLRKRVNELSSHQFTLSKSKITQMFY